VEELVAPVLVFFSYIAAIFLCIFMNRLLYFFLELPHVKLVAWTLLLLRVGRKVETSLELLDILIPYEFPQDVVKIEHEESKCDKEDKPIEFVLEHEGYYADK